MVRRWEEAKGALTNVSAEDYGVLVGEVGEAGLSPYRQPDGEGKEEMDEGGLWRGLVEHVTPGRLAQLLQGSEWEISSSSSMVQDRDEIPGVSAEDVGLEERELRGLGIDLKRTWREGAVGRERTEGARDWSWALEEVVERAGVQESGWGEVVLGQMEICFLMVVTVGNYSCLEEWKRCVGLVLGCRRAVRERQGFFEDFLGVLGKQVERFEDVEGELFDMSDGGSGLLKGWLRGFQRILGQAFQGDEGVGVKARMEDLISILKRMYGWDLGDDFVRKGMVQLEDGEMVELEVGDMHGEDEDGDYAPVVVDINDT